VRKLGTCAVFLAWFGILSQARAGEEKKDRSWKGTASLGGSLTDGNSDSVLATASLSWEWTEGVHGVALGLEGAYGEAEEELTSQRAKARAQYDRKWTKRWYAFLACEAEHDDIAEVEYRAKLAPGVGLKVLDTSVWKGELECGPAYVREELEDGTRDDIASIRLAQKLECKLSETARVWELLEYLPDVTDWGQALLRAELGVEAALVDPLSIRLVLQDHYDSEPSEGLEKNDLKVVAALLVHF